MRAGSVALLLVPAIGARRGGASEADELPPCVTRPAVARRSANRELAAKLAEHGFDRAAVSTARNSFSFAGERPYPRWYAIPPWSLPPAAVRVIALAIDDPYLAAADSQAVAAMAVQAAADLSSMLPSAAISWAQPSGTLHATIFHPGVAPGSVGDGAAVRRPSASQLAAEVEAAKAIALSFGPRENLTLIADRVTMTPGGVMLLLLREQDECGDGVVDRLRAAAAQAFPLAPAKQARGLIHVSLLRVLKLPAEAYTSALSPSGGAPLIQRIHRLCKQWTQRLRGRLLTLFGILHLVEDQIITLAGRKERILFGNPLGTLLPAHGLA